MAKSPRKSSNNKGTELGAFITFPGVDSVTGELIKHSENGVNFEYLRYGSRYKQFFPAEQIVALVGTIGSKESMLWFRTDRKTLWNTGKRDRPLPIEEPKQYGNHLIRSSSPDFSVILMDPKFTTIIGKSTEGGSGRGRKKNGEAKTNGKKAAKSGGGKKKTDKANKALALAAPKKEGAAAGKDWN